MASDGVSGSVSSETEYPVLLTLACDDQRLVNAVTTPIAATEKFFLFRSVQPPKKLNTANEYPVVAFGSPPNPGKVRITSTGKLIHTMCVHDGKQSFIQIFNDKHKTSFTVESIQKNLKTHGTGSSSKSIWAMVYVNISTYVDSSKILDCKVRAGWGSARIPILRTKDISSWLTKRPFSKNENENDEQPEPASKAARTDTSTESHHNDDVVEDAHSVAIEPNTNHAQNT